MEQACFPGTDETCLKIIANVFNFCRAVHLACNWPTQAGHAIPHQVLGYAEHLLFFLIRIAL
jgi:hypothetical protein